MLNHREQFAESRYDSLSKLFLIINLQPLLDVLRRLRSQHTAKRLEVCRGHFVVVLGERAFSERIAVRTPVVHSLVSRFRLVKVKVADVQVIEASSFGSKVVLLKPFGSFQIDDSLNYAKSLHVSI